MVPAKKSGKFDYDAPIAGIKTPDRYTLRIHLEQTDYNFMYVFATPQTGGVARGRIRSPVRKGATVAKWAGTDAVFQEMAKLVAAVAP